MIEHQNIFGDRRACQRRLIRCGGKALLQRADRGEIEARVAPLHDLDRLEGVRLQRLDELGLERRATAGRAEGTVAAGATGTARNLCELSRAELAELITVE